MYVYLCKPDHLMVHAIFQSLLMIDLDIHGSISYEENVTCLSILSNLEPWSKNNQKNILKYFDLIMGENMFLEHSRGTIRIKKSNNNFEFLIHPSKKGYERGGIEQWWNVQTSCFKVKTSQMVFERKPFILLFS